VRALISTSRSKQRGFGLGQLVSGRTSTGHFIYGRTKHNITCEKQRCAIASATDHP